MYSCVAPGPPCSKSTLIRGLLPVRFVQTVKVPFGVVMGIRFTPPVSTSSRPALSKYAAVKGLLVAGEADEDEVSRPVEAGPAQPCRARATTSVVQNGFNDA